MAHPGPGAMDHELRELLGGDEQLLDTAGEVRSALHEAAVDPAFARRLGAEVVARRRQAIEERSRRRRWLPRGFWPARLPSRPLVALAATALVAVVALTAIVVPRLGGPAPVAVLATSAAAGMASFDPAGQVVVRFSRPMDHQAVAAALHLAPATAVRTSWSGEALVVTPLHGLAPNSPYVLTIDRSRARTAAGAPLANDLHVVFGTAPLPEPGGAPPPAVALPLRTLTAAAEGSEAVIVDAGVAIAASASRSGASGLLRLRPDGAVERLAAATDAICVSRSGSSLAYLERDAGGSSIVMASSDGSAPRAVSVPVDDGSPLGWIDDAEVSFVGGGQLRAVDRAGHVRVLSSQPVNAAKDTVVISPGGRYVYLRSGSAEGSVVDLTTGVGHALPDVVDQPAFSADGGTVGWFDGPGSPRGLALAPSAGGPVLRLPLALVPGDRVSDLGLAPAGGRFVYTVHPASGQSELRLAATDDGATLAVARGGGASPNWAPDGGSVAVLAGAGAKAQIAVADVPRQTASVPDAAAWLATAFASAQVERDQGALRALATSGVSVAALPAASRASIVQVSLQADGSYRAELRLVVDPTPGHPAARAFTEELVLRTAGRGGPLVVAAAPGALADLPPGAHVTRVAAGATPGTVALTFDADLDPASVRNAFTVSAGTPRPVAATYDVATRTVTLSPASPLTGPVTVTVHTGLRDIAGQRLPSPLYEGWSG
jgi:hypothetical protein